MAGLEGDDLGPHIADVRIGLDGQIAKRDGAHHRQEKNQSEGDEALAQRER
jgi:hypothetical protein